MNIENQSNEFFTFTKNEDGTHSLIMHMDDFRGNTNALLGILSWVHQLGVHNVQLKIGARAK